MKKKNQRANIKNNKFKTQNQISCNASNFPANYTRENSKYEIELIDVDESVNAKFETEMEGEKYLGFRDKRAMATR